MAALASTPDSLPQEFSRLYEDHFAYVWRLVGRWGVPMGEVEDVVQDVFMVVHRRLADFEQRSSVRTWLAGITRRVVWRHRRGRDRAQRKHEALQLVARPEDAFSAHRGAALQRLERFVQGLPEAQREVFVLSELEGLRGPEIAQATGSNLNTVYARIRATRGRFAHWCDGRGERPHELARSARVQGQPPAEAERRVWALLAARLPAEVTAVATAAGGVTSLKVFAVVLGV
ncbi:MAG: RNA polymerase sigma factor, partial [Myxococcales bacterium]|nr:RNA polymerase sigma factor [Myxococcales bacterium]